MTHRRPEPTTADDNGKRVHILETRTALFPAIKKLVEIFGPDRIRASIESSDRSLTPLGVFSILVGVWPTSHKVFSIITADCSQPLIRVLLADDHAFWEAPPEQRMVGCEICTWKIGLPCKRCGGAGYLPWRSRRTEY